MNQKDVQNVDESHKYDVDGKKPHKRDCMLFNSIYITFKNRQN